MLSPLLGSPEQAATSKFKESKAHNRGLLGTSGQLGEGDSQPACDERVDVGLDFLGNSLLIRAIGSLASAFAPWFQPPFATLLRESQAALLAAGARPCLGLVLLLPAKASKELVQVDLAYPHQGPGRLSQLGPQLLH